MKMKNRLNICLEKTHRKPIINNCKTTSYSDGLAPWTRAIANPLLDWRPSKSGITKKTRTPKKAKWIQGELFPCQLAQGQFKRTEPVDILQA